MNAETRALLDDVGSPDGQKQNAAYLRLLALTDQPVDWAYEAWDELLEGLGHKDNHVRAISSQVLCNLAKSDPDQRMLTDFGALLAVTRDERFVTARHCLQSLWKVGAAGAAQRAVYLDGLETRFHECASEKNCTLIRHDIIQSLRNVYDAAGSSPGVEAVKTRALALIETEPDPKYRKKYTTVWKDA